MSTTDEEGRPTPAPVGKLCCYVLVLEVDVAFSIVYVLPIRLIVYARNISLLFLPKVYLTKHARPRLSLPGSVGPSAWF